MATIDFGIYRVQKLQEHLPNMFEPSRRDAFTIIFSGPTGTVHFVDEHEFLLPPYSVLFVGPDRVSRFDRNMTDDTYVLLFSSRFFSRSNRDLHFLQHSPLFNDHSQIYYMALPEEGVAYGKVMVYLLYQAKNGIDDQWHKDLAHNLVEQILIMGSIKVNQVCVADYKQDLDNFLVLKYKELIAEHFVTEKAVKFYAEQLNITARRLTKATEEALGMTAKEVITDYVLTKAKRQLVYTEKTAKEISVSLGFSGEQNFSAFFMKNAGLRPSEFRKQRSL
ncbi:AraC family transcriptional regulator [Parapedobacter soli]|uniref:AraC family transcriptional regulator n=1 Tax=Parapedobacter soli TaxID=416955 RepID=UPI0021C6B920|nr:helix-turn-helix domain-containing protein [Parapedobacter soli]